MVESAPVPVRLPPELICRLDAATKQLHMGSRATLIRFCLLSFLDHIEGMDSSLAADHWQAIFNDMKARTKRQPPPAHPRTRRRCRDQSA